MPGRLDQTRNRGGVPVKRLVRSVAILAGLLVAAAAPPAHAIFDDLDYSARAVGLGGAYAGLSDDASAAFYNPAGLVNLRDRSLRAMYFQPYNQDFQKATAFAVAGPTASWGSFAIGYSDFRVEYLGSTLSIERALTFSHALRVMEDITSSLSFGYNINVYNLDYPTRSVSGIDLGSETTIGIDVGFQARLYDRTTAGAYAKNINAPTMGDPVENDLPQRVSAGMAYRPYDGVITAVELEKEIGEEIQFHGGMEFQVAEPLVLRVGAQSKPNVFDVGMGLHYSPMVLDVTYSNHPVLDETLRFGVGLRF